MSPATSTAKPASSNADTAVDVWPREEVACLDIPPTAEQVAAFHRLGFALGRDLLDAREVEQIRDVYMRANENGPVEGISEKLGGSPTRDDPLKFWPRMLHPHRHPDHEVGRVAIQYMLDERLRRVLRGLMTDEPLAAQSMFYFKPPGARRQALHQDNTALRVTPGTCYAAWIAIDDTDEENGGMVMVPQTGDLNLLCPERVDMTVSFIASGLKVPEGRRQVLVPMKAGDVLFFNGSLIHGSYPNTSTDRFRRSLIFHYVPASCEEVADFYKPLLDFEGAEVEKATATGGGPCGEAVAMRPTTSPTMG